jgi:hypothetical protein
MRRLSQVAREQEVITIVNVQWLLWGSKE